MAKKKLLLDFPQDVVSKPITYRLIKDYGLIVNIFKARFTPEEKGELGLEVEGDSGKISEALEFLKKEGVKVTPLEKRVEQLKELCTDCGACLSLCPIKAISRDPKSFDVKLDSEKCIACELCVDACPLNAIKVNF
ncbi:MAG: 4Fe-4S binding protein [Candidatus Diapherotrites archaeon]